MKTTGPLTESDIPADALKQMKAGAVGLVRGANDPPRDKLPSYAQRMRTWVLSRWQHVAAHVNPFELEEIASLRTERAKREYPLGDMPLVVITRGIPDEDGPGGKLAELEHAVKRSTLKWRRRSHETAGKSLRSVAGIMFRSRSRRSLSSPQCARSLKQSGNRSCLVVSLDRECFGENCREQGILGPKHFR